MSIQRYGATVDGYFDAHSDGDYVKHADHIAREKELVEALQKAQRLLSVCEFSAFEDIEAVEDINAALDER